MATNREWLLLVWILKKGDYSYLLAYSDKLFICVMTLRKWMGVELFASLARRMMAEECKLESNQCRLLLYFLSRPLAELYLPLNLKINSLAEFEQIFHWFLYILICSNLSFVLNKVANMAEKSLQTFREPNPDLITYRIYQVNVKCIKEKYIIRLNM